MKIIGKKLCAISASVAMAASLAVPASAAAPWTRQQVPTAGSNVVTVQYRHHGHRIYRRHGHAFYHGHRGYRHHRRGYRRYNGYWFPPAAFIAGAIIGGAITSEPRRVGSAHVRWCEQHYRSYDVRSDTFQPYHGPRRRCASPY